MEKTRKIRCFTTFIILIILIIILLIMNVCIGTVHISFKAAFATLYDHSDRVGRIVWDIRMPRAIAAMILGGALALAGYLLQTFFHNPIAGPFVLGISSGAKMIVALVMVFLLGNAIRVSSLAMIAAAFLGAMLSMGFVLIISRKVSSMSMLVVSGVMIGYICSAVTEFVVTFADDSDIVNLHNWSRGSFSGMTWDSVGVMSIVVGITFVFVFLMAKPGIISGVTLAFARAIGEYGATSMLAGNIAGKTSTISQQIAMVVQSGDYATAGFWCIVIIAISFACLVSINMICGKSKGIKRKRKNNVAHSKNKKTVG